MYTRPPRRRAKKTTIRESPSPARALAGPLAGRDATLWTASEEGSRTVGRRHPSEPATLEAIGA